MKRKDQKKDGVIDEKVQRNYEGKETRLRVTTLRRFRVGKEKR